MTEVMEGRATPAQIAGLLVGLAMKETPGRDRWPRSDDAGSRHQICRGPLSHVFDTCGTGGDRSGTVDTSSAAAVVVAACGVRVAKHGNRSVSSVCGSADVFAALGVDMTAQPEVVERCLETAGIAFFFAPTFHPAMKHAGSGPSRPVDPDRIQPSWPVDESGRRAPAACRRAAARADRTVGSVPADAGIGPCLGTSVRMVSTRFPPPVTRRCLSAATGVCRRFTCIPRISGCPRAPPAALKGGDAPTNARIIRAVLQGEGGPLRDVVLLNAAAALFIAGRVASVREGLTLAGAAIDSGDAIKTLEALVRSSQPIEAGRERSTSQTAGA